ncbi:MAG: GNAT family N-acetyltransferase [Planctomycetota bacterium]|nr:GNAT family N-acetyltransferase [Planctomycetota bacterium]
MADITTRAATHDDAPAGVRVLRRSITELCTADHQNDAETIETWLSNKTEDRFAAWVDRPDAYLVVAEADAEVVGVGMLGTDGQVRLCYVLPGYQGRGVGRALMDALETQARAWGVTRLTLESSLGARAFYRRAGYVPCGDARTGFGVTACHPFEKRLDGASSGGGG